MSKIRTISDYLHFRVDPRDRIALEKLAKAHDRSLSYLIRTAIKDLVAKYKGEKNE